MSRATATQVDVVTLGGASRTRTQISVIPLGRASPSRSVNRSGAASLSSGRHTLGDATETQVGVTSPHWVALAIPLSQVAVTLSILWVTPPKLR
jgi:hypothetical protein